MDKLQDLVTTYLKQKEQKLLTDIIKALEPLICKKARELSRLAQVEYEDMKQELYIVVLKKISLYDETKGKFITYVFQFLKGDPTDTIAAKVCKKRGGDGKHHFASTISLNTVINEDGEDKETTLEDTVASSNQTREDIEYRDMLNASQKLSKTAMKNILGRSQR